MNRRDKYQALLLDIRWQNKRNKILKRDEYKCVKCSSKKILQVHHLKYKAKALPWEYSNSDLITLCSNCHYEVHQTTKIKMYNKAKTNKTRIEKLIDTLSKKDKELQLRYDKHKHE